MFYKFILNIYCTSVILNTSIQYVEYKTLFTINIVFTKSLTKRVV